MNRIYTALAALALTGCIYVKEYSDKKTIQGIVKYDGYGEVYVLAPAGEDSVEIYNEAWPLRGMPEGTLVDVVCKELNRYNNKHGEFVDRKFLGLEVDTIKYNPTSKK